MRISITVFAFFIFVFLNAQSSQSNLDFVPGEIAVHLSPEGSIDELINEFNSINDFDFKIRLKKELAGNWNFYSLFLIPSETDVESAADILSAQPNVIRAFPDRIVKTRATEPNDPTFGSQWGLERIGAPDVWDNSTGGATPDGKEIVVAVLDSGFDINHDDLVENLWVNRGENPGDGIDNDGNGLIDDIHGWNYKFDQPEFSEAGHGTAVCGVIGAKGNNATAVAGVNWDVKIMLFEIFSFTSIIESYHYIAEQRRLFRDSDGEKGAFVVITNGSWGTDGRCEDNPEFDLAYDSLGREGILSAVATLNNSANVDLIGDIPTSCGSDYLITVGNSNQSDEIRESGFGKESIDLTAPGFDISTLWVGNQERVEKGTSMSTPFVAGGVALLYSQPCQKLVESTIDNPAETALALKGFILAGTKKIPSHETKTVSGGRLDLRNTVEQMEEWCRELVGDFEILKTYPNPVNATLAGDKLKISYSTPDLGAINYRIFNTLGQLVIDGEIIPDPSVGGVEEINVDNLYPGTYFISLEKGTERLVEAFVKI